LIPSYLPQLPVGPIYFSLDRFIFLLLISYWFFGILFIPDILKNLLKVVKTQKPFFILFYLHLAVIFISSYLSGISNSLISSIYHIVYIFALTFIPLSIPLSFYYLSKISKIFLFIGIFLILVSAFELFLGTNPFTPFIDFGNLTEVQQGMFSDITLANVLRIKGTFSNPLSYGQFIVLFVPVLFFFRRFNKYKLLFNILMIGLLFCGIMTKSRATFIIISLVIVVSIIYMWKSINFELRIFTGFFVLFSCCLFLLLSPNVSDFFGGKKLTSDNNRESQLMMASPLIFNKPFFGYGFGQGSDALGYGTENGGSSTIDNYFLTITLDTGLLGLLIFILLYSSVILFYKVNNILKPLYFGLLFFMINLLTLSLREIHPIYFLIISILILIQVNEKSNCHYFSQLQ
tara:strand:+ start:45334 stop:46542 length:1209 start_codon:yes stop_codon:yes gene_type:complete